LFYNKILKDNIFKDKVFHYIIPMRYFTSLILLLLTVVNGQNEVCKVTPANNCVTFTVSQGTGCSWMCNYCANQLGTNNYYFTDNVCTYQQGVGCIGNPIAGKSYTCCSA
jgi:hypothetical protein